MFSILRFSRNFHLFSQVHTDDPFEEEEEVFETPEPEACETTLDGHTLDMVPPICSTLETINGLRTANSEPEVSVDLGTISNAQTWADSLADSNLGNVNGLGQR